ncbi:hypothetical protein IF1G_09372 [Cordyceps javanica]|uniref:Uncharacterized protein n=1 Tax=Cordyceps javanica TaxID=43265 RepID=A0A545UQP2_9HYPO|nr:hypothetical protein IF1G_09372 [Cordyceps javanica]
MTHSLPDQLAIPVAQQQTAPSTKRTPWCYTLECTLSAIYIGIANLVFHESTSGVQMHIQNGARNQEQYIQSRSA